ncbi:hypothetical protein CTRI78_v006372 [Colletotrichum trifolii]|uniref:Uncharacterized protein n=1 Tax=Colletotrichum trifolii TaxID=5466 RepID=A0A4R8RNP3_COLTR|nr:hypothetical protein CTRI78_v006372 [Colletotrichum trifolii]
MWREKQTMHAGERRRGRSRPGWIRSPAPCADRLLAGGPGCVRRPEDGTPRGRQSAPHSSVYARIDQFSHGNHWEPWIVFFPDLSVFVVPGSGKGGLNVSLVPNPYALSCVALPRAPAQSETGCTLLRLPGHVVSPITAERR